MTSLEGSNQLIFRIKIPDRFIVYCSADLKMRLVLIAHSDLSTSCQVIMFSSYFYSFSKWGLWYFNWFTHCSRMLMCIQFWKFSLYDFIIAILHIHQCPETIFEYVLISSLSVHHSLYHPNTNGMEQDWFFK
jgi:hypothetical protein